MSTTRAQAATAATLPAEAAPSAIHRLLVGLLTVLCLLTPYLFDPERDWRGNELVGDGLQLVTQHEVLTAIQRNEGSVLGCLTTTWWGGIHPDITLYRPLSTLLLGACTKLSALSYATPHIYDEANPGLAPVPFHLVAMALKVIAALLVLELGWLLLGSSRMALCAGALFATLPVHGEVLFDPAGLAELLCCTLSLGAWIAWVRAGDEPLRRPLELALAGLLLLAASLAKESAFALPLVFFLTDVGRAREGGFGAGLRHALRKLPALALCALVLVGSLGIRLAVAGAIRYEPNVLQALDNPLLFEDPLTRVANALRLAGAGVLAMLGVNLLSSGTWSPGQWDLSLGIGPFPYSADYSPSQIEVLSAFSPLNLLAALLVLGSIAVAVLGFRRCRTRAGLWLSMFAAMAVTSNVLFPIGTIYAERLLLFPSAALVLLLGATLGRRGALGVAAALLLSLGGGIWTVARAHDWGSNKELWRHTSLQSSRDSARAHYNWGIGILREGFGTLAAKQFQEAVRLHPGYADAHAQLGAARLIDANHAGAQEALLEALRLRLEAQQDRYVPLAQQDLLGVGRLLDLYLTAVRLGDDVDALEAHADRLQDLLDRGYLDPLVAQQLGEAYRMLLSRESDPDRRAELDRLAVESFERSIAIEPTATGLRSFGDYLERVRGDDESVALALSLYAQAPDVATETERAALLIPVLRHRVETSPDTVLRDIVQLLEQHRAASILTPQLLFEAKLLQATAEMELFDRDPTNPQEQLANIYDHLRRAIELTPAVTAESHFSHVALFQVLLRMGEFEDARHVLEHLIANSPPGLLYFPVLHVQLGEVHLRLKRWEDALSAFGAAADELLAVNGGRDDIPTLREARRGLVLATIGLHGEAAAEALLEEWMAAAPEGRDEIAQTIRAERAAARGEFDVASEMVGALRTSFPATAGADPELEQLGRELDAVLALIESYDPDTAALEAAYELATRRIRLGDLDGAADTARAILRRELGDEDRAGWLDVLATTLQNTGDLQGALDALNEALALERVSPEFRQFLKQHKGAVEGSAGG